MRPAGVDLRVLGPVELWYAGEQLRLTRRQQRHILGLLALQAGKVVTAERLTQQLWGDQPPKQARAVLQTRVSEIRTALAGLGAPPEAIELVSHSSGYQLRIPPESLDSNRFLELARSARVAASITEARTRLRAALALWRGPVLDTNPDAPPPWATLAQSLHSAQLTAVEDLFTLQLRAGDEHTDDQYTVADQALAEALGNPTRERLQALALRALHAAGRTTDGLRHYDRWRRWLRDELGADPKPDIQRLHLALLRGDDTLPDDPDDPFAELPTEQPATDVHDEALAAFRVATPNTLPADIADFTGRTAEAEALRRALVGAGTGQVAVAAIAGRGGVGKTALSVHVAHSLRTVFSDGQLYVNLRGVEEDEPAAPPEVLSRFLRTLGVDGSSIPDGLDERTDLYRSLLADRRVLVLLDNATDDEQVAPLIPGGPGCAVIITSRRRLGAVFGATTVALDVLDDDHASALLSVVGGAERVAAEPAAAADLCAQCGYLPLAIRVAGGKLASKPHWSVAKLAEMLRDERGGLDQFSHGHLDVRASIALSYRELDDAARALLRRLGELDLPEYPVWVAAAAMDSQLLAAEALCEQLFDAQLLDIAGHDATGQPRFRLHDLVRLFAREAARAEDSRAELDACLRRVAGGWLYLAGLAWDRVNSSARMDVSGGAVRWVFDPQCATALVADAMRWFDRDYPAMRIAIRQTARREPGLCWELAVALNPFLEMSREFERWQQILDEAWVAAAAGPDRLGQAALLQSMGLVANDRVERNASREYYLASIRIFEELGEDRGIAVTLMFFGALERQVGDEPAALRWFERALPLLEKQADPHGTAFVLRNLGQVALLRGDFDDSNRYFERALTIYTQVGSELGRAQVYLWRGLLWLEQGRIDEAQALCQAAFEIALNTGDKSGQAMCLHGIALCHARRGSTEAARSVLLQAVQLVRQARPTMIDVWVRKTLADLDGRRSGAEPIAFPWRTGRPRISG